MTTSPYDNLPQSRDNTEPLEYIDVDLEEAADADTFISEPAASAPEPLHESYPEPAPTAELSAAAPSRKSTPPAATSPQPAPPAPPARKPQPKPKASSRTTPFSKPPVYSKRNINNLHNISEYILPFEESLLVPDTMADVEKILFAEGRANLTHSGIKTYQKNDFLSGEITVFTIYQPAGNSSCPVDAVKSSISFRTDKCWGDSPCDQFRAEVSIISITAEMINERKFMVRGELLIHICEFSREELNIFESADDKDLMLARSSIEAADLIFEADETTEISQEITLREDQPSPIRILENSIRITENHRQITSGKLVINATIHSQILYLGEDVGQSRLTCITNKTDFTQFIPAKDDMDVSCIRTSYNTSDLKISVENQDHLLLQGNIVTSVHGFRNCNIPAVTDAYHKIRDISFDTSIRPLTAVNTVISGEISSREVINSEETDMKPETLLCGHGLISDIRSTYENGRIAIEGSLPVKLLALDENSRPFVIRTTVPVRGVLETPETEENPTFCTFAYIKDFWFDKINSRQLEVNISIAVDIWLCCRNNYTVPENLCFAEDTAPARRVSMAVYVVDRGDTLWDVAKRYKCDIGTLAQLNQIDQQQPLPAGMKLFIMK